MTFSGSFVIKLFYDGEMLFVSIFQNCEGVTKAKKQVFEIKTEISLFTSGVSASPLASSHFWAQTIFEQKIQLFFSSIFRPPPLK